MRLAFGMVIGQMVAGFAMEQPHPEVAATGQFKEIPSTGRYFYIDYTMGDQEGLFYSTIEVGPEKQVIQMWASTNQSSVGIITD